MLSLLLLLLLLLLVLLVVVVVVLLLLPLGLSGLCHWRHAGKTNSEDERLIGVGVAGDNLLGGGGGHPAQLGAALELEALGDLEVL
jgi:hypothetical protein